MAIAEEQVVTQVGGALVGLGGTDAVKGIEQDRNRHLSDQPLEKRPDLFG
jgi:hypothetical protein